MSGRGVDAAVGGARRATLRRRVRTVVALTIAYNLVEGVLAVGAGAVASSAALVGFGLDSFVEVLSAGAIAWQFAGQDHERRERVALRVVAVAFLALAAYVGVDAGHALLAGQRPDGSRLGIAVAAVSLVVMPLLSWFERRTGRELGSASVVADSHQTLVCTYLSAALLVGLLADAVLGWWWADPAAALVIAVVAAREGVRAWRGDACCAGAGALLVGGGGEPEDACGPGCASGCCS